MVFRERKLYVITWGDAWAKLGEYHSEGDHTPMKLEDVGWVVEENEETICICTSRSEVGNERNLTVIPWYNVISMEELI